MIIATDLRNNRSVFVLYCIFFGSGDLMHLGFQRIPEFYQKHDQWFRILWYETGAESDRAICIHLKITL